MFFVSCCSCLHSTHWSQVLIWEWRCSWSSADRRCSNYIWVINNFLYCLLRCDLYQRFYGDWTCSTMCPFCCANLQINSCPLMDGNSWKYDKVLLNTVVTDWLQLNRTWDISTHNATSNHILSSTWCESYLMEPTWSAYIPYTLQWHHNGCNSISKH